jgi:hypothetical protein
MKPYGKIPDLDCPDLRSGLGDSVDSESATSHKERRKKPDECVK